MQLLHKGSVKNVYQTDEANRLCFAYTDDYSVFDWGKMPDTITGKGKILAEMGEFFFKQIEDIACWERLGLTADDTLTPHIPMAHHMVERQENRLLVKKVRVPHIFPKRVAGLLVYDYQQATQGERRLIPLEVLFRFGVPAGSSLLKRQSWYPFAIEEGIEFSQPLIEFSTKLEKKDRVISYQEASLILQDITLLQELHAKTRAVALFLKALLAEQGLKLWDGKLEWGYMNGTLHLIDSIGPDELRVSQEGVVFSKQFLRDFYQNSAWESAINKGLELAQQRGEADWVHIVQNELGQQPQPLSTPYLEAAVALYADFYSMVVQGKPSRHFLQAKAKL